MGAFGESRACLRIIGDTLDPDEISRLLGKPPTRSERKGEIIRKKSGERIAKSGSWRLEAADRRPEDLDGQVEEILSGLTADLDVWRDLASKYRLDLFCGLFMQSGNDGLSLSPRTMLALGERGIEIVLDTYRGDPE